MERVEGLLTVFGFVLIVGIVVAQTGGGVGPDGLLQLLQAILDLFSEFASLFDGLFGGGLLSE